MRINTLILLLALAFGCRLQAEDASAPRAALNRAVLSEGEEQLRLVRELAETGSGIVRTTLTAWRQGSLFIYQMPDGTRVPFTVDEHSKHAVRIDNGEPLKDEKGDPLKLASGELTPVDTTSKLRKAIMTSLDLLTLADPDPQARRSAVVKLGMQQKPEHMAILQARVAKETNSNVRAALQEAMAIIELKNADPTVEIAAIKKLSALQSIASLDLLTKIANDSSAKGDVIKAAQLAVKSLQDHIFWVDFYGTIFRGFSLGSILLVVALGLAITFGLMGVINMAHGEIMVVGAYTTYAVQNVFGAGLFMPFFGLNANIPGLNLSGASYQSYFLVALPLAFLTSALVGILLERGIIRFLYTRPLESLLATWGVSLVLQQLFRLSFGSNNVQVYSPSWLSGNFTVSDVILGWNRLFVIGFAIVIVIMTWLLLTKTPLGLLIRAVMQNREMAACMGVRTERVNMLTFGFGSGLAGLAGAFLSQIGNVGPGLGQNYIVDCFMTVVVGGVGNIIGTICSALGIGVADQILQQVLRNPVMGKITVLAAIILFLQWRPAGLFSTRSRSLEG